MAFGFLSNSFFICLGICLVVIGILSFLLSKEVLNQNHKITTMCELVTTMAQDLQMLKMQQTVDKIQYSIPQSLQIGGNHENIPTIVSGKNTEDNNNNNTIIISGLSSLLSEESTKHSTNITNKKKIVVSDCEYSESESEPESELDDDDEDTNADSDADDERSSYEDTDDEVADIDIKSHKNENSIFNQETQEYKDDIQEISSILSIDEDLGFNKDDPVVIEIISDENNKIFHIDIQPSSHATIEEESSPVIVVSKLPSESMPIKEEELPVPAIISSPNYGNKDLLIIDDIVLSSHVNNINTSIEEVEKSLEEEGNETNYNKMNIQQLRKVVTDRKLATNPTKLKKNELLQLLTNEQISTTVDI